MIKPIGSQQQIIMQCIMANIMDITTLTHPSAMFILLGE